ncbi:MAG: type II/IV secretion system protein [Rhodobacter sp.]|nr:type II/IV secretion system protein [Paracoccaceae bacterium]MCC0076328.1 type II/IV secretion system protein [Rhodobacter sp.]
MSRARLPFAFARDNQVALDDGRLLIGPAATPNGLREARRRLGDTLHPEPVDDEGFQAALTRIYDDGAASDGPEVAFDLEETAQTGTARDLLEDPEDAPVIRLVNQMLRQAVRAQASDLHLEPHEEGLRARMRVDGTMQSIFDRRDVPGRRVVSRLKVMAGLDIAETRLPQDGRIALRLGGRAIDVRLSTLPGHHGERVVMRLLDRSGGLMALDRLGLTDEDAGTLNRLASLPNGIILATGPTGSGKTTTLYSLLRLADRRERNILTVEDPVEYDLPGISQTQVNSEIGLTFARGLRSILRQDPDVILVGEIRDSETAQVASEAALTGHLVFSSLHANTTLAAVVRMRELGVEGYLIAATLRGVVAQRLVRRLCPSCARRDAPDAETLAAFAAQGMQAPAQISHAQGCPDCDNTGFSGRIGVFDILEVDETLRHAIDTDASEVQLRAAVGARPSLMAKALARVATGETSMGEIRRVFGAVSGSGT